VNELSAGATTGVAFVAGLISFLSPCILPVMPAYLTVISGLSLGELRDGEPGGHLRRRVLTTSFAFVAGFSAVFVALGASASWLGGALRTFHFEVFGFAIGIAQLAGAIVIAMGLHLAGWLRIPALSRTVQLRSRDDAAGLVGAFTMGAAFAFGWSPYIGPVLGTILAIAGAHDTVARGIYLLAVYSAGLAVPFLLSGWSIEFLLRLMSRMWRHLGLLEKSAGLLLVAIGVLMVTDLFVLLDQYASEALGGVSDLVLDAEDALIRE
jgi:cytochrome c-type biogenesis protein